jgi:hypothetical protein
MVSVVGAMDERLEAVTDDLRCVRRSSIFMCILPTKRVGVGAGRRLSRVAARCCCSCSAPSSSSSPFSSSSPPIVQTYRYHSSHLHEALQNKFKQLQSFREIITDLIRYKLHFSKANSYTYI